jgi:hypothetical protein
MSAPRCEVCAEDPEMIPKHNATTVIHCLRYLRSDVDIDMNMAAWFLRDAPAAEALGIAEEADHIWGSMDLSDAARARLATMLGDIIDAIGWEPIGDEYERIWLGR